MRGRVTLLQVLEDLAGRVGGRSAGDAASRVRPCAAHVEAGERPAVAAPAQERTGQEELVQGGLAVEGVAAGQPVRLLEDGGRQHLPVQDVTAEARGVLLE